MHKAIAFQHKTYSQLPWTTEFTAQHRLTSLTTYCTTVQQLRTSPMNFDLYFTVNERDLQAIDDYISDWAHMEHVDYSPERSPTRTEDSLTDIKLASLQPCPLRTRLERSLMKPLPPIPEDASSQASSRPTSSSHDTVPRSEVRPKYRLTPSSSPCQPTTDEVYRTALQRRPRVNRIARKGDDKYRSDDNHAPEPDRLSATRFDPNLSPSSQSVTSAEQPTNKKLDRGLQHWTDKLRDADYDSVHSPETSDLARWASEMYGSQQGSMTALREKRCRRPSIDIVKHRDEPVHNVNKSPAKPSKLERFYGCSDTSVSSFNDFDGASSYNPTTPLAGSFQRPLSEATEATSFFDFNDDEDELLEKRSDPDSRKRFAAKEVWRKMSVSLRAAKGKLPAPQTRSSGLPPIDVAMILT